MPYDGTGAWNTYVANRTGYQGPQYPGQSVVTGTNVLQPLTDEDVWNERARRFNQAQQMNMYAFNDARSSQKAADPGSEGMLPDPGAYKAQQGIDALNFGRTRPLNPRFVGVPGLASGTDFWPGGQVMVGEKGPEMVNLPRGSQVLPNDQTAQLLHAYLRYLAGG